MPATQRQQQADDRKFRDAAMLLFAGHCLEQRGIEGAMGCGSLARDFADDLLAKRNEPTTRKQP